MERVIRTLGLALAAVGLIVTALALIDYFHLGRISPSVYVMRMLMLGCLLAALGLLVHVSYGSPFRMHLTLAGWLFLAMAVLVGLVAVKSQAALMFVVFGGMMGALHMSAILAHRSIAAVMLNREVPDRVWQNQTIHMGYFLRNCRKRTPCLGLHVEELSPEGVESATGYCVYLPPRSVFRAGARFAARRRGRIQFRGVRLRTVFPFSLISSAKNIRQEASMVVWPAKGRLRRELLYRGAVETSSSAPSPATGGQDEFFGLREFRPDDNPRWIHWRRSANRPTPIVREMAAPLPEILWVLLDTYWDDLSELGQHNRERRIRFAATLIDHAFTRGYKVGLLAAYQSRVLVHQPKAGLGHRRKLLDALAEVDDNSRIRLEEAIAHLRRGWLGQAQVIIVTDEVGRISDALATVRIACRHLTAVDSERMRNIFEDSPLAEAEAD